MNLKKRVENNPFVFLLITAIGSGSAVAGLHQYFTTERIDRLTDQNQIQIKQLEASLAGIQRRVGGQQYLDVRKLFLDKNSRPDVSPSARFFAEDGFYASSDTTRWTYSRTTETQLAEHVIGGRLPDFLAKAGSLAPIHLWQGKESLPLESTDVFKTIFPYVLVQKFPFDKLSRMIGLASEEAQARVGGNLSSGQASSPATVEELTKLFRGDVVGRMLTTFLVFRLQLATINPGRSDEIINIQKAGNVLYAQFRVTLNGVKIQHKAYSRYYLVEEYFMGSTATDLYIIETFVPSDEIVGRGGYFTWVTRWLDDFKIVSE